MLAEQLALPARFQRLEPLRRCCRADLVAAAWRRAQTSPQTAWELLQPPAAGPLAAVLLLAAARERLLRQRATLVSARISRPSIRAESWCRTQVGPGKRGGGGRNGRGALSYINVKC